MVLRLNQNLAICVVAKLLVAHRYECERQSPVHQDLVQIDDSTLAVDEDGLLVARALADGNVTALDEIHDLAIVL